MDASKMTGGPIPTLVKVDVKKRAFTQEGIHNRWHPDVPAYASVKPGTIFKMETHEWTGGQVKNDDNADDIRNVDLTQIHYLSGPIAIEGAEPGDLLVVDILDVRPHEEQPWGFTGVFEKTNGGGLFATEFDSHAAKVCTQSCYRGVTGLVIGTHTDDNCYRLSGTSRVFMLSRGTFLVSALRAFHTRVLSESLHPTIFSTSGTSARED